MSLVLSKVTNELRQEFAHEQDRMAWTIGGVLEMDAVLRKFEEEGEIKPTIRKKLYEVVPKSCLDGVWYKFAGETEKAREARRKCTDHLCWICANSRGASSDYVRLAFKDASLFDEMREQAKSNRL